MVPAVPAVPAGPVASVRQESTEQTRATQVVPAALVEAVAQAALVEPAVHRARDQTAPAATVMAALVVKVARPEFPVMVVTALPAIWRLRMVVLVVLVAIPELRVLVAPVELRGRVVSVELLVPTVSRVRK